MEKCKVCGHEENVRNTTVSNAFVHFECPLCGQYKINTTAVACSLGREVLSRRHQLSGLLRTVWTLTDRPVELTSEDMASWEAIRKKTAFSIPDDLDVIGKADAILRYLRHRSEHLGCGVEIRPPVDYSLGFCINARELLFVLDFMRTQGWINASTLDENEVSCVTITPGGWAYLSGVSANVLEQGFIAMRFKPDYNDLWRKGIIPGIRKAGYKDFRVDEHETNDHIDDEIIAGIRRSRFVVADVSEQNAGVYFEAGFALGLDKKVVWTCEQAKLDTHKHIHSDTQQYKVVPWTLGQYEDFAMRLTRRIDATIGHGPKVFTGWLID